MVTKGKNGQLKWLVTREILEIVNFKTFIGSVR
jgi:hypothetical protein